MSALDWLDVATRVFWMIARAIGVFFILACWRAERQRFYLWLAASWALTSVYAAVRLALPHNELARWAASVIAAPGSVLCGIVGFARLNRYLRLRIITIRRDHEGHFTARSFADEDARDTLRPIPPRHPMEMQ